MYEYEYITEDSSFPHRIKSIDDADVDSIFDWLGKYIEKYNLKYDIYSENINLINVPVNGYSDSLKSRDMFNELYCYCKDNVPMTVRTKSGGISINKKNQNWQNNICSWFYRDTNNIAEIFVACSYVLRIQIGTHTTDSVTGEKRPSGKIAFSEFSAMCKRHAINLNDYQLNEEEASQAKSEIKKPLIDWGDFGDTIKDMELHEINHIDFHSAYMSGLMTTHPEFSVVAKELYNNRKEKPKYKAVMNHSIGYMQSMKCCGAKWAHLSRDAINYNYDKMISTAENMRKNGFVPLLYNTDGIWYCDSVANRLYHDENEGPGLCQWSHDYVNVRFRVKSIGAYEFEYQNKEGQTIYKPVVRGTTELDRVKSREKWQWGDIYTREIPKIVHDYERGLVEREIGIYDIIREISGEL